MGKWRVTYNYLVGAAWGGMLFFFGCGALFLLLREQFLSLWSLCGMLVWLKFGFAAIWVRRRAQRDMQEVGG